MIEAEDMHTNSFENRSMINIASSDRGKVSLI